MSWNNILYLQIIHIVHQLGETKQKNNPINVDDDVKEWPTSIYFWSLLVLIEYVIVQRNLYFIVIRTWIYSINFPFFDNLFDKIIFTDLILIGIRGSIWSYYGEQFKENFFVLKIDFQEVLCTANIQATKVYQPRLRKLVEQSYL